MKDRILIIIIIVFTCSCANEKENLIKLISLSSNQSVSDSLFFKNVGQIQFENNSIYILDNSCNRIIQSDLNFNLLSIIGKSGKGPGELQFPDKFIVCGTNLFVKNNTSIYLFHNTKFKTRIGLLNNRVNSKFAIKDSLLFISTPDSSSMITVLDKESSIVNCFGERESINGSNIQLTKYNEKNVFITNSGNILLVGSCNPTIELYDSTGVFLSKLVIENSLVQSRIDYAKDRQKNPLTVVELYSDVYFSNNSIYLLTYDHINKDVKVSSNKIIKIDIIDNNFVYDSSYELYSSDEKEGYYTAIGILPNYKLIAYEHLSGTFQSFSFKAIKK